MLIDLAETNEIIDSAWVFCEGPITDKLKGTLTYNVEKIMRHLLNNKDMSSDKPRGVYVLLAELNNAPE